MDSLTQSFAQGMQIGIQQQQQDRLAQQERMQANMQMLQFNQMAKELQDQQKLTTMFQSKPEMQTVKTGTIGGVNPQDAGGLATPGLDLSLPTYGQKKVEGNQLLNSVSSRKQNPEMFSALISQGLLKQALALPDRVNPLEKGVVIPKGGTLTYGTPDNPQTIAGQHPDPKYVRGTDGSIYVDRGNGLESIIGGGTKQTSAIEKRSIGNDSTQDFRVWKDSSGNAIKEEKVGEPYKNNAGVAAVRIEPQTILPNPTTGAYFDKKVRQWKLPTGKGEITLSGQQVKDMGLEVKEQATASDIKSMQQSAPAVIDFASKLTKQITDAENGLGPLASRWRELKQGKIGLGDPAFTGIKTNIGLLTTRLMKMHVGARGGEYIMQHFDEMLDIKKQSPENLLENIRQITDYASEAKQGRIPDLYGKLAGGTSAPTAPAPPAATSNVDLSKFWIKK